MINYPTLKNKNDFSKEKKINNANKGMALEDMINKSNEYYQTHNIAFVSKRPTSIKILKTSDKYKITEAVFLAPSTLDYVGVCQGHYLDFEAKETTSKKGFPMSNIASHQLNAMEAIIKQKGITFAIIFLRAFNEIYLIDGQILLNANKENKTIIPYDEIKQTGHLIKEGYFTPVDYIKIVKDIYFEK
jgi:recombination protein U